MKRAKIIAEIGCNHKGDMEIAKELVKVAKIFGNADAVKFQKRSNKELLTREQYEAPHPNLMHAYGDTYGEHREYLELTKDQHEELKLFCESLDIEYSTSVWDLTSAKEMNELNVPAEMIESTKEWKELIEEFQDLSSKTDHSKQEKDIYFVAVKVFLVNAYLQL